MYHVACICHVGVTCAPCDLLDEGACHVYHVSCICHVGVTCAPCDLLDEDGRETLGAQLLVDAEEVDLHDRILPN